MPQELADLNEKIKNTDRRFGVWQVLGSLFCSALWLQFLQENSFSIMQRRTKRVPTNLGGDLVPVI